MINLFLITLIVVYIVDLSGFIDSVKQFIWRHFIKVGRWQNVSFKPFSCSLCLSWWVGLIYIFVTNQFTIPMIAYVAALSFLTGVIGDALIWVKDIITTIINFLYKLVKN